MSSVIIISDMILTSIQYLASLRARKKTPKTTTGRGKHMKTVLLDLDGDGGDEDDGEGDNGIAEGEMKSLEDLDKKLSLCGKCGPTKICKINKFGVHVPLSFNQQCGWAVALVSNHSTL